MVSFGVQKDFGIGSNDVALKYALKLVRHCKHPFINVVTNPNLFYILIKVTIKEITFALQ